MNNLCDSGHETRDEIRLLPTGGDGNSLVCYQHYLKEMEYRREQAKNGVEGVQLPEWADLKIYNLSLEHEAFLVFLESRVPMTANAVRQHWERGERYYIDSRVDVRGHRREFNRLNNKMGG